MVRNAEWVIAGVLLGLVGCGDGDAPVGDAPVVEVDVSGAMSPGGVEPIIPEPAMACPDFVSGSQQIMDLTAEVLAGTPGEVKGPLLFTWHGTGGSGKQALTQLPQSVQDDILAQGGIIVAANDSDAVRSGADVTTILNVWYDGHDLEFADLIVACAVKNHNIDPRQIFVTGCSAGGLMAGTMAIKRASYVAAAAPNSGGVVTALPVTDTTRIPAIFAMHGGANDNVIVNFEDTTNNLASTMVPAGAHFVDCNHGIGHCRAPASLHESAWEFMKAHPYGVRSEGGVPASAPDYCAVK